MKGRPANSTDTIWPDHVPADGVHLGVPLPRAEPASHNADAAHREHPHDGEHPQQQRKQIIHTPASGYAASRAARWAAIFLRMRMAVSSSIGRPATRPDPAEPTFAEGRLQIDVVLSLQRVMNLMPQRADGHAEHGLAALQQCDHLVAGGAFMHLFPIAHDGDMLKLVDIALHQEPDGRSDVLQVHARIQQLLGHRENHHVLEGVQSPRPRSVRWG